MVPVPGLLDGAFVLLVLALGLCLVAGLDRGLARAGRAPDRRRPPVRLAGGGLALWLAVTGAMASSGFLRDFAALPPRIAFAVVPALAAAIAVPLHPATRALADSVPGRWIVALQSFRVLVEVILWRLAAHHALPAVMTWEGRNLDVLIGLTAPLVAWLGFGDGARRRGVVVTWNVAGLAFLTNVLAHGLLSAPTPFRLLVTDPPNAVIAQLPWVWLPAFVVPVAYFLHVVSLGQRPASVTARPRERAEAPPR
jgi:hypothetical protein